MKTVIAKLSKMRVPQKFVVYPKPTNVAEDYNLIMVQSERAIGQFDKTTGKGLLNYKGSNPKYGMHLAPQLGAELYQFPMEFVQACIDAQPKSGDEIGAGIIIG